MATPRSWSKTSFSEMLVPLPPREKLRKYGRREPIFSSYLPQCIAGFLTLFESRVAVTHIVYERHMHLTNQVVPLLSVVVGLILVFRNGTSYDRWYEGSKDWETLISHTRNLTRHIWVNVTVADPKPGSVATSADLSEHQALREEKIRFLYLIAAYLVAVKHRLRSEPGTNHRDLDGLLPEYFSRFDHETTNVHEHTGVWENPIHTSGTAAPHPTRIKDVGTSQTRDVDQRTPLLNDQHHIVHFHSISPHGLSLPLVIAHELTRMLYNFKRKGYLDTVGPAGNNGMNQMIQGMVGQLAKANGYVQERVLNTPIPASYGIHLKQCVTLYLFTLPFTLVSDLGWFMIPVVTVVSFTLMGIEGIADEIEMPFGYDYYDLPLDRMCDEIKAEIRYTIDRLPQGPESYLD